MKLKLTNKILLFILILLVLIYLYFFVFTIREGKKKHSKKAAAAAAAREARMSNLTLAYNTQLYDSISSGTSKLEYIDPSTL